MALQLKEGETFNNVEKVKHVEMALEALRNALRNNPGKWFEYFNMLGKNFF